jgi:hypothetical protein
MSKTYTREVNSNSTDSHQTSPAWVVTFSRFNNRDTKNYQQEENNLVRKPLVVENDCISIAISSSKANYTPSATMTFLGGDLNYSTAVAPGDFVTVNIVNDYEKSRNIADRARAEKPINKIGDGFKGVFKINSVNKIINTDPNTGQKILRYQVTAYGFTEFNNIIYYNPTLGNSIDKDVLTYQINEKLLSVLNSKKNIQEVLEILPNLIIGNGRINATNTKILSTKKEPYIIPQTVFKLLGLKGNSAVDLYKIMIGTWNNKTSTSSDEAAGLNPDYKNIGGVQRVGSSSGKYTLSGRIPIQTSPLTNVRLIDLLKRYSNSLMNEIYFCYRVDKDTSSLLPKVVIRQKPFNTEHGKLNGTRYLGLPRWKVSPDLIYNINISKNESLRFNFVHIIGTTGNPAVDGANLAFQNANKGTVVSDEKDIQRHGLRPYTSVSNFDWPVNTKSTSYAPQWAKLCFDWIYGGHLRTNGQITLAGIEENICVGDNLELQNTVYHIEAINHIASISPNGPKSFRTTLVLTHGVDKRSSANGPVYPEMDFTDTLLDRQDDYKSNDKILPGFSDTQDIRTRDGQDGEEIIETPNESFTPDGKKQK